MPADPWAALGAVADADHVDAHDPWGALGAVAEDAPKEPSSSSNPIDISKVAGAVPGQAAPVARVPSAIPNAPTRLQALSYADPKQKAALTSALQDTPGGKIIGAAASVGDDAGTLYKGLQETVGQTGEPFDKRKALQGGADILNGGGSLAFKAALPEIGAGVAAGAVAQGVVKGAAIPLLKLGAGLAAGQVSAMGAEALGKKLGLSPEAIEFAKASAFFAPVGLGAIAAKAGLGAAKAPAPEPPPPPASAAEAVATQQANSSIATMSRYLGQTDVAKNAAAGVPPPAPPPPVMPAGLAQGELTSQVVRHLSQGIAEAPPETRAQLALETHKNLAGWMAKQGSFVGPDGKVQLVDKPEMAAKLAQDVINTESERAQTERQQQAEAAAQAAPSPAVADLLQRRPVPAVLGAKRGPAPAAVPEPITTPESRATVDAQVDSLKAGTINAVHLPEEQTYSPVVPAGYKKINVPSGKPGAGTWIYNPRELKAAQIKEAATNGTHGELLGHVQDKAEVAASPDATALQARLPDGTPVQDSAVTQDKVPEQAAILGARHPRAKVVERNPEDVIREREQAHTQDIAQAQGEQDDEGRLHNQSPDELSQLAAGGEGKASGDAVGGRNDERAARNLYPVRDGGSARRAPESLTAQGLEAGKAASARTIPGFADKPIEEQNRLEADNMAGNTGQMDANVRYIHDSFGPEAAKAYAASSKDAGETYKRLFGPDDASQEESHGNPSENPRSAEGVPEDAAGEPGAVSPSGSPDGAEREGSGPEQPLQPGSPSGNERPASTDRVADSGSEPPRKGEPVRFRDRNGEERAGTVRYADDRIASIKGEDGKNYDVKHEDILRGGADSEIVPRGTIEPERESAGGDVEYRNAGVSLKNAYDALPESVRNNLEERIDKTKKARDLGEGIHKLGSQQQATMLRIIRALKETAGGAKDQKAISRHLENPSLPLTEKQQQIKAKYIDPILAEDKDLTHELQAADILPAYADDGTYVPRIAKGKGSQLDRAEREVQGKTPRVSHPMGKNVLSKKQPSSFKHRVFMALESPTGERRIVAFKSGKVTAFDNGKLEDLGDFRRKDVTDGAWTDKNGTDWKVKQATTPEITQHTGQEYHEHALLQVLTRHAELVKYKRALDFLNAFKEAPEFKSIGFKPEGPGDLPPDTWKPTSLPQLRGYYFEPRTAEVLDDYDAKLQAGDPGSIAKVGEFLTSAVLLNPFAHLPNLFWESFTEKGVGGILNPLNKVAQGRALVKAFHAVLQRNDNYLAALDAGGPLKSAQFETRKYADVLVGAMKDELEKPDSSLRAKLGKVFNVKFPIEAAKAINDFSSRVTWYANDISYLQSTYEKTARGVPLEDALEETGKHLSTYRLPSRILDSRSLGKLFNNHALTAFSGFHYSRNSAYGRTALSALGAGFEEAGVNAKGEPINKAGRTAGEEQIHGLSIAASLFLSLNLLLPALDKAMQAATGNPNMEVRRAGPLAVPYGLMQTAKGEANLSDVLRSIATPNLGLQAAGELAFNRDLHSGRHIYNQGDTKTQIAKEIGSKFVGSFAPSEGRTAARDGAVSGALSMFGMDARQHGALKVASMIAAEKSGGRAMTPEDNARYHAHQEAIDAIHAGNLAGARKILADAHIAPQDAARLVMTAKADPLAAKVRAFSAEDLQRVMDAGTAQEKAKLAPMLAAKKARERAKAGG